MDSKNLLILSVDDIKTETVGTTIEYTFKELSFFNINISLKISFR